MTIGYVAGLTGKTRDGRDYRVIAVSQTPHNEKPVCAEILWNGKWQSESFTADGFVIGPNHPCSRDLDKEQQVVETEFVVVVWDKNTGKYLRTTKSLAADNPESPLNRFSRDFAHEVSRLVGGHPHTVPRPEKQAAE